MNIREFYVQAGGDFEDLMTRIPMEHMVGKFVRKYISCGEFENLVTAYESRDYQKMFEASHNLKGMSANLSLNANSKTISMICEAVRGGEPTIDLEPLMEQAKQEHAKLVCLVEELEG